MASGLALPVVEKLNSRSARSEWKNRNAGVDRVEVKVLKTVKYSLDLVCDDRWRIHIDFGINYLLFLLLP